MKYLLLLILFLSCNKEEIIKPKQFPKDKINWDEYYVDPYKLDTSKTNYTFK